MIPKERILLLPNLDGATTKLQACQWKSQEDAQPSISTSTSISRGRTNLRDQNPVTRRNAHGHALAIAVKDAGPDCEHFGLVLVLDAALGEEYAGGSLGFGFDALDQDAVEEGGEVLDVAEDGLLD